ncbi:1-deoxy-D-xylulose-5-phosphate reductoisomerase [Luteibaculum oceani]|uniref:1-deoxy-D-xylulose 5-phosphate reductoisomerase n=1 Tax=Luteibaculum oceani TaxID=1294296 RepID=A0A5C6VNQ8_9FLAO|nr:1-deoxy-D-xylulose-5-phosphate reductoisomerase [Luteibaculum oceani]TXC85275.1 1-deoxy-D-xylulose-5-phosphate reductoisomerase [Luteibaculum oceani]
MEGNKKGICILGSTGSIGTQTLDVIRANQDKFQVQVLVAGSNYELLYKQAVEFEPIAVVINSEEGYNKIHDPLFDKGIKVYQGKQAICDVVTFPSVDVVLTAMVGAAGLDPTIAAIKSKKVIALANKETLVVGGHLIAELLKQYPTPIIPVDSEHSAIFQCLVGEGNNELEKVILTASGGPFRGKTRDELQGVTLKQALKHPNWSMGAKITIDSATMMNKGLELIEAKWLFSCPSEKLEVIVHPQSIIHSLVQFTDGSMKAQMGLPDMKLPIQYALAYPNRISNDFPRFNFMDYPQLNFEQPDLNTFKNLQLAYDAIEASNGMACVLNAANEVTVDAFLKEKIGFLEIGDSNEEIMGQFAGAKANNFDDLFALDQEVRMATSQFIKTKV